MPKKERFKILALDVDGYKVCTIIIDKVKGTADIVDLNSDEGRKLVMDIVKKGNADTLNKTEDVQKPIQAIRFGVAKRVSFKVGENGNFRELFVGKDIILDKCGDEVKILYINGEEKGG